MHAWWFVLVSSVAAQAAPPAQLGLCVACHHDQGRGGPSGTPRLAGQDEAYLRTALAAYRDGDRNHAAMQAIAGALSDADIAELSRWYAAQPAVASP
jgi:cytochrome c553